MKITSKRDKDFNPIEITIKIENKEEWHTAHTLFGSNVTIPEALSGICHMQDCNIVGLMNAINKELLKYEP